MGMFKGGGGFLNNVVITILGTTFDTLTGEGKNGPWTKLSMELSFLQDGQTEPQTTYLDGGFLYPEDGVTISADKRTLEGGTEGEGVIKNGCEVAEFIRSLIAAGFPVEKLDPAGRNFAGLNGYRVKTTKVKDEERTKRQGKQKSKNSDREFDFQQLRVAEVVSAPVAGAAPAAGKPAAAAKPAAAKATAAKAAPAAAAYPSAADADEAIVGVLAISEGEIERGGLSSAVVKFALSKGVAKADREKLRVLVISDAYLADAEARGLIVTSEKSIVKA